MPERVLRPGGTLTAADRPSEDGVPVINLAKAPGAGEAWDRPRLVIYLWAIAELLFVTNAWQVSSSLRVQVLRLFGATIGENVIFRPRTRVKFPWKLHIGDRSWIGEGVQFHNQDYVCIEHDVVISQETFLTTGSHAHRRDMALITKPITVRAGAWVTTRCVILGGVTVGRSAVVAPMTLIDEDVPENTIFRGGVSVGKRFGTRERPRQSDE